MKKLLALVLALVMVMGLSVVSTNAAFNDGEKIDHTEAVEVMNALNIINGYEDGSYKPDLNVTRAQMAKMVSIAVLGEIDPAAFAGAKSDLTDITGHWAEGYIKFCVSQGIVAGRGNGKFDPEDNVNTAEAAKMLLVALGYNAEVRKYVGNSWTLNVMRDAQQKGLLDELTKSGTTVAMDRDDAAQMIYNTLTAERVVPVETYNSDGSTSTQYINASAPASGVSGTINETLLGKSFDGLKKYGYITNISYDSNKKLYSYTVTSQAYFGAATITAADDGINGTGNTTLKSAEDYSTLFGQRVVFVYDSKDLSNVYGIYSDSEVLVEGVFGQIKGINGAKAGTDAGFKVDGTRYDVRNAAAMTTGNNAAAGSTLADVVVVGFNNLTGIDNSSNSTLDPANTELGDNLVAGTGDLQVYTKFAAIDNDDDGKVNVIVAYPQVPGKVTFSGSTSFTVNGDMGQGYTYDDNSGNYTGGTFTGAKYSVANKPAKGDYVLVDFYPVTGKPYEVTKIETSELKVTGLNTTDSKVQAGGEWYNYDPNHIGDALAVNSTYKFQVVNGSLAFGALVDSASTDLLYVIDNDGGTAAGTALTKVLFADGTVATVGVSEIDGTSVNGSTLAAAITKDRLYTYTKNSDNTYSIDLVGTANLAGYDAFVPTTGGLDTFNAAATGKSANIANATPGTTTYAIDDTAVVFLKTPKASGSGYSYKIIDGKTMKTWKTITDTLTDVSVLLSNSGSIGTAKVLALTTPTATVGTDTTYAYITSSVYTTKESGVTYQNYTAWTADGELEVKDGSSTTRAKHDIVALDKQNDGTYVSSTITKSTTIVNDSTATAFAVAVTGYSATDKTISAHLANGNRLSAAATISLDDDDIQFLYIDAKNAAGSAGGEISTAERLPNGKYIMNAYAIFDNDNNGGGAAPELFALIVDTTNKMYNGTATFADTDWTGISVTPTAYTVANKLATGFELANDVAWKASGSAITAGSAYAAIQGEVITATVKGSTTAGTALTNPTSTLAAGLAGTGGTLASEVVTEATYLTSTDVNNLDTDAQTGAAAGTAGTITITKANASANAAGMKGGEYAFTWTVGTDAPTLTLTYTA